MLRFLQDELMGLKSRWARLLGLLTCLALALVVLQQQRAIEAQGSLISALSADSNRLQELQSGDKVQPRISMYITDSKILEPASEVPVAPAPLKRSPARFQHQI